MVLKIHSMIRRVATISAIASSKALSTGSLVTDSHIMRQAVKFSHTFESRENEEV